jgi:hypothetical protein
MLHDEFIQEFLETFPEFTPVAQKEFACWRDQPPLHIFLGSVLDPFLVKELDHITNPRLLIRIFQYLEKLSESKVAGVKEAILHTLTWLANYDGLLERSRNYMGTKTLKLSLEVEAYPKIPKIVLF